MSTAVFPSLSGLTWPVRRSPSFRTRKQTAIAGQEVAIADMPYPRWIWELRYSVLRQGSSFYAPVDVFAEFATLVGFYNARNGGADSFQYQDPIDNTSATNQAIVNTVAGTTNGDGSTKAFQLQRSLGSFLEPIYAPNVVSTVRVNGVAKSTPADYSVLPWGTSDPNGPGIILFVVAPPAGQAVDATFTYYWPVRFMEDRCDFEQFDSKRFRLGKLSFQSILL